MTRYTVLPTVSSCLFLIVIRVTDTRISVRDSDPTALDTGCVWGTATATVADTVTVAVTVVEDDAVIVAEIQ